MTADDARVSLLRGTCPDGFQLRTVTLQPGDALPYHPADWHRALVVVEVGDLEVECRSGTRAWFAEGAVLVLSGLDPRRLRNPGSTPLLLSALSRAERTG